MPGIDIAIGVTSYHLADRVRLAKKIFSRAMHGLQKKPPSREMENDLSRVLRTGGNDFEYS